MRRHFAIGMCLGFCLVSPAAAGQTTGNDESASARALPRRPVPASVRATAFEGAGVAGRSVFSYPEGLSLSPENIFERLGYFPANCLPMTSDTTYDVAFACFIRGMYSDAVVFASHGLTIREDARLYLLKGVSEMHLGRCRDAEATAGQYLTAVSRNNVIGLPASYVRINGPMRVRFEQILKQITAS